MLCLLIRDATMSIRKISPNYDSGKLGAGTLNDRIDVYEDRVRGWLIDCGHILNRHEHAGFGVLQIGLGYFEGFAVFLRGEDSRNRSFQFFQEGFSSVFSEVASLPIPARDSFAKIMYYDGRCGLFHLGMTRPRVVLSDGQPIFRIKTDATGQAIEEILIDRYGFIEQIDRHHSRYVARLRDLAEVELRNNFDQAWELVHQ
jgi:hypothetical protein